MNNILIKKKNTVEDIAEVAMAMMRVKTDSGRSREGCYGNNASL